MAYVDCDIGTELQVLLYEFDPLPLLFFDVFWVCWPFLRSVVSLEMLRYKTLISTMATRAVDRGCFFLGFPPNGLVCDSIWLGDVENHEAGGFGNVLDLNMLQ